MKEKSDKEIDVAMTSDLWFLTPINEIRNYPLRISWLMRMEQPPSPGYGVPGIFFYQISVLFPRLPVAQIMIYSH